MACLYLGGYEVYDRVDAHNDGAAVRVASRQDLRVMNSRDSDGSSDGVDRLERRHGNHSARDTGGVETLSPQQQQWLQQAESHFRAALSPVPHSVLFSEMLVSTLRMQGRVADAVSVAEVFIEAHPQNPNAHRLLASCFASQADRSEESGSREAPDDVQSRRVQCWRAWLAVDPARVVPWDLGVVATIGHKSPNSDHCFGRVTSLRSWCCVRQAPCLSRCGWNLHRPQAATVAFRGLLHAQKRGDMSAEGSDGAAVAQGRGSLEQAFASAAAHVSMEEVCVHSAALRCLVRCLEPSITNQARP